MTREEKLLPCPFCGNSATITQLYEGEFDGWFIVVCDGCCVSKGNDFMEPVPTEIDAIRAWNTRTRPTSELSEEAERAYDWLCEILIELHQIDGESPTNKPLKALKILARKAGIKIDGGEEDG